MPMPYPTARRKVREVVLYMTPDDRQRLINEIVSGTIRDEGPRRTEDLTQDERILDSLREHGPSTAEQIAQLSGLTFTAARARMSYLANKDLVRHCGRSGRSKIWSLT